MKLLIASEQSIIYKLILLFKCCSLLLLFYSFVGNKSSFARLLVTESSSCQLSVWGELWGYKATKTISLRPRDS